MIDALIDPASPPAISVRANASTRYDIRDEEQARAMLLALEEHGYAVVAQVANQEQIAAAVTGFWEFWEAKTQRGLLRNDPRTWKPWVANSSTGILVDSGGANHCEFLWNTRTLPLVKEAFARIWEDPDLLVSFDAGNVFRDWRHDVRWLTAAGWWHVDQNATLGAHRQGRRSVQGLVTYFDATAETGGLTLVPGSHKEHEALCGRAPGSKMRVDFVPVPPQDPLFLDREVILVCARAGDLILWDSRTVHCNSPALSMADHFERVLRQGLGGSLLGQTQAVSASASASASTSASASASASAPAYGTEQVRVPELLRLVGYVCMLPRSRVDAATQHARKRTFVHKLGTSHWPDSKREYFPEGGDPAPWTKSRDVLSLVGYSQAEMDAIEQGTYGNRFADRCT
eukprot:CAMPEP_0173305026 /NCGR_PEP_ID=MMETSP1143-20121109/19764_1 /TAXON_ID=483371 /ORGANISM="non described non described, Strain CCMP2298" /LENGTH=400 /DNA_ID=CAMNT_0014245897 /DNA_START=16 /DNA_END=1214 /DNA_ORIENTATION=+